MTLFVLITPAFTTYALTNVQDIVESQLEGVAAKVASNIDDLVILAKDSNSGSMVMEKQINIPATLSQRAYSVALVDYDGVWKVKATLDSHPSVFREATLTWTTNSTTVQMEGGSYHVSSFPLVAKCVKTTDGESASMTIQLARGD
jgi:hypothetical protein